MSCFVTGNLFTEVLPLCGCLTFLKANDSPGLQTCFGGFWTCAQCAGSPLCEVFTCTCTGSACFAVIAVVAGAEGVVVLKGVLFSGTVCTVGIVLELYWYCMALCLCHRSCRIWKMLDVPSDVPHDVPLPVFTLLKFGTLSPFNTFSSG